MRRRPSQAACPSATSPACGQRGVPLENPFGDVAGADRLSLFPRPGALAGGAEGLGELDGRPGGSANFDGGPARGERVGAYDAGAAAPAWPLALERKTLGTLSADGFESGDLSAWSSVVE
ncbi:MAG: hypothetical protein AAFX50_14870 [Acidobacteriota bacterium]